jgi:hypothetical protein
MQADYIAEAVWRGFSSGGTDEQPTADALEPRREEAADGKRETIQPFEMALMNIPGARPVTPKQARAWANAQMAKQAEAN